MKKNHDLCLFDDEKLMFMVIIQTDSDPLSLGLYLAGEGSAKALFLDGYLW